MKLNTIILAAAAVLATACFFQEDTGGRTLVKCKFGGDAPDSVKFTIGEQWDTTVAVVKNKVKVLLPVDKTNMAFMLVDADPVVFVSDGSRITIDTESGQAVSDDPDGITSRMHALNSWESDFMEKFSAKMDELEESEQDAYVEKSVQEYNDYHISVVEQNKDNVVSLLAVSSIQLEDDAKMMELLQSLSDDIRQDSYVQKMIKLYETKAKTGEGSKFIDFTVVQDPENPKKSTVSLSDYVGKGKYVLVDFWASWCGPCKEEIPYIQEVYKRHKGRHFNVLSVAVWDEPDASKQAAKDLGIKWDQIINAQQIPTELYGIEGIPHLILFDPEGVIVARGLRGEKIEEAVSEALSSAKKK